MTGEAGFDPLEGLTAGGRADALGRVGADEPPWPVRRDQAVPLPLRDPLDVGLVPDEVVLRHLVAGLLVLARTLGRTAHESLQMVRSRLRQP